MSLGSLGYNGAYRKVISGLTDYIPSSFLILFPPHLDQLRLEQLKAQEQLGAAMAATWPTKTQTATQSVSDSI